MTFSKTNVLKLFPFNFIIRYIMLKVNNAQQIAQKFGFGKLSVDLHRDSRYYVFLHAYSGKVSCTIPALFVLYPF
jgi:hypothetical protein